MTAAASARQLRARDAKRALAPYAKLGTLQRISPINALLSLIYEAAGNVQYFREKVSELERLVVAGKKEREEVLKIVVLYNEERDRLQKYTSDALRIGIESKQVRLYELQAQAFVAMARAMVEELGLTGESRERALRIAAEQLRTCSRLQPNGWRGPFIDNPVDAPMIVEQVPASVRTESAA